MYVPAVSLFVYLCLGLYDVRLVVVVVLLHKTVFEKEDVVAFLPVAQEHLVSWPRLLARDDLEEPWSKVRRRGMLVGC